MTAFTDYTDLRLAVSEQVGNREISDVMDRFTKSAEAWFNRELRCREMLTLATLTFTNGAAPLPADFIEVMSVADAHGFPSSASVRGVAKPNKLGYTVTPTEIYIQDLDGATRELEYYAKIPTLTSSLTASNWLLQKSPNLYLYTVSLEAAKWVKDADLSSALAGLIKDEMSSLMWADVRGRFGSSIVTTAGFGP
jgi:hypothetical protein